MCMLIYTEGAEMLKIKSVHGASCCVSLLMSVILGFFALKELNSLSEVLNRVKVHVHVLPRVYVKLHKGSMIYFIHCKTHLQMFNNRNKFQTSQIVLQQLQYNNVQYYINM